MNKKKKKLRNKYINILNVIDMIFQASKKMMDIYCFRKTIYWDSVLVSRGCCSKLQSAWWCRTTESYSLTDLVGRTQKSVSLCQNQDVGRASSLWRLWEKPVLCLSPSLVDAGFPWLVATSLQTLSPSSHLLLLFSVG